MSRNEVLQRNRMFLALCPTSHIATHLHGPNFPTPSPISTCTHTHTRVLGSNWALALGCVLSIHVPSFGWQQHHESQLTPTLQIPTHPLRLTSPGIKEHRAPRRHDHYRESISHSSGCPGDNSQHFSVSAPTLPRNGQ